MQHIGKLLAVDVTKVWDDEPNGFTPWLEKNTDYLGEALGMDLRHEQTEVPVGKYRADLLFLDVTSDKRVVVENMFNETDHDHVGKLLTYAAGLDAAYAVLIAPSFRAEHRSALNFLNHISKEDFGFFGLVLEAWKIGESLPAPHLRVEVEPDNWTRSVRASHGGGLSNTERLYQRFWDAFMQSFHDEYPGWSRASNPRKYSWMSFPSSRSSILRYSAAFCKPTGKDYGLRAEAYIDTGDAKENGEVFDRLLNQRERIEQSVGAELEWDRLEGKRASRISWYFPKDMHVSQEDTWGEARIWLVEAVGKVRDAFNPVLDEGEWDDLGVD